MAKIDPNKDGDVPNDFCGVGVKLFHYVGHNSWKSQKGTSMISVGLIVLADKGETSDAGKIFVARFANTHGAVWRLARFVQMTGFREAFDPDVDEDLIKALSAGAVVGELKMGSEWKGKSRVEQQDDKWGRFKGEWRPDWDETIAKGKAEYQAILRRSEERRKNYDSNSGSGGGYSGGGGGNSGGGGSAGAYDDVPF